jgi:ADP-ribose pyrophosphatase
MDLEEKVEKREILFRGRFLLLENLRVRLPNGNPADREVVRMKDSVAVLPLDGKGQAILVRQHRPAIARTLLEIPAGLIEEGESAEEAAVRECEEETGYRPLRLKKLLDYAHAEGYSTGMVRLFSACPVVYSGKIRLDQTECLETVVLPLAELRDMLANNELLDSKTILALLLGGSGEG